MQRSTPMAAPPHLWWISTHGRRTWVMKWA